MEPGAIVPEKIRPARHAKFLIHCLRRSSRTCARNVAPGDEVRTCEGVGSTMSRLSLGVVGDWVSEVFEHPCPSILFVVPSPTDQEYSQGVSSPRRRINRLDASYSWAWTEGLDPTAVTSGRPSLRT